MNHDARFPRDAESTFSRFFPTVAALFLLLGWLANPASAAVGAGAAALLAPEIAAELNLSPEQRQQIQVIVRTTAKKFNEVQSTKGDRPA